MNRKYLVAAALLVWAAAPLSAQSVRAGIDAWQRADYSGAVAIWRPLAEKGDADAEFNLGQAYRLGRGVATNLSAAKTWFERAANKGHLDAETTLGLLLFQNGEQADGLKWLKKAAAKDEPRALLVYGTALVNGDGVAQDPVLGYAYVSRAAAQGLGPARATLDQLDQLLPVADRKRGTEIARGLAKRDGAPAAAAAKSARAAPAKAAPKSAGAAMPPPKPVAKKPPLAAGTQRASGAWRIQLGAFSQRSNAEALYRKLSGKDALAGRGPFYVSTGAVTRLQVGPFESKSTAQSACNALGVACFPVPAK
jgi:cell division septation protein DedD